MWFHQISPQQLQYYIKIIRNRLQAAYSTVIISIRGSIIHQRVAEVLRSARYLGNNRLVFLAFFTFCPKDWKCLNSSFEPPDDQQIIREPALRVCFENIWESYLPSRHRIWLFPGGLIGGSWENLQIPQGYFDGFPIGPPRIDIRTVKYTTCNLIGIILI